MSRLGEEEVACASNHGAVTGAAGEAAPFFEEVPQPTAINSVTQAPIAPTQARRSVTRL